GEGEPPAERTHCEQVEGRGPHRHDHGEAEIHEHDVSLVVERWHDPRSPTGACSSGGGCVKRGSGQSFGGHNVRHGRRYSRKQLRAHGEELTSRHTPEAREQESTINGPSVRVLAGLREGSVAGEALS